MKEIDITGHDTNSQVAQHSKDSLYQRGRHSYDLFVVVDSEPFA